MYCVLTFAALAQFADKMHVSNSVHVTGQVQKDCRLPGQDEHDRSRSSDDLLFALEQRRLADEQQRLVEGLAREEKNAIMFESSLAIDIRLVDRSAARLRLLQRTPGVDPRDIAQATRYYEGNVKSRAFTEKQLLRTRVNIEWGKRILAAPLDQRNDMLKQWNRAPLKMPE